MASEISPRAEVSPKAKIGDNCKIYPFVYIEDDVVIGDNCIIFPFVSILNGTRMGNRNKIHQGTVIAALPQDFEFQGEKSEVIIGDCNVLRENVVINRGTHAGGKTIIGNNNFLMEGAHILHDTKVGNQCVFGYGSKIAGDCEIGDGAILTSAVLQLPNTRVGEYSTVLSGSVFNKDVPPYIIACGNPATFTGVNTPMCQKAGFSEKTIKHIANAYRLVFHGKVSLFDATNQIKDQIPDSPERQKIIDFLMTAERGVI